jgi:hypothetical protein
LKLAVLGVLKTPSTASNGWSSERKPRRSGVEGEESSIRLLWLCGWCRSHRRRSCWLRRSIHVRSRSCRTSCGRCVLCSPRAWRGCSVARKEQPPTNSDKCCKECQGENVPGAFFRPCRSIPGGPVARAAKTVSHRIIPGRREVISGSLIHLSLLCSSIVNSWVSSTFPRYGPIVDVAVPVARFSHRCFGYRRLARQRKRPGIEPPRSR